MEEFIKLNLDSIINNNVNISNGYTHDLLFNISYPTKELAYAYGYMLGQTLYSTNNNMISLINLLEKLGLKNIRYEAYPDIVLIKANSKKENIGKIHIYESGIIAGFLSAHTKLQISVDETSCEFNNDPLCVFQAKPGNKKIDQKTINIEKAIDSIDDFSTNNSLLLYLPFLENHNLFLKTFYEIGKALKERGKDIEYISRLFDIEVNKRKIKKNNYIIIRYKPYNSYVPLVRLSLATLFGFTNKQKGVKKEVREGSYKISIRI